MKFKYNKDEFNAKVKKLCEAHPDVDEETMRLWLDEVYKNLEVVYRQRLKERTSESGT